MLRKLLSLLCLLTVGSISSFAQDEEIILGMEDGWRDLIQLGGLTLVEGKWNTLDIRMRDGESAPDEATDLLLHFNRAPFQDHMGHYSLEQDNPLVSRNAARLGDGAAAFASDRNIVTVVPAGGTIFEGGWEDFSLEFWLYPVQLTDVQTVLQWAGALTSEGKKQLQFLRCRLENRRIVWDFLRFFTIPERTTVSLAGISNLLPREWHHHLLRFDADTGLLEYLLDGVPEAVTYVTGSGSDGGTVYPPKTSLDGRLAIGEGLTGLVDELRLSRVWREAPFLGRYPNAPAIGITRVFDLGYVNSRLKRIEPTYSTPFNSDIYFYYRMSDEMKHAASIDSEWIPFAPDEDIVNTGRFLQLKVELMSGGDGDLSPSLSAMKITYEPDLPPPPPSYVSARAGNGVVELNWRRVNVSDVSGYMVYYGFAPGRYNGSGAAEGSSPIDVSDETRFTLTNLENGRLYYVAVVSYDSSEPAHQSRFSMEVSSRPSRVGR